MSSSSGDRFTIRIGRDAHGPVVAGHENHVEAHGPRPEAPAPPAPGKQAGEDRPDGPDQTNTAKDHGSLFASQNGVQTVNIHHHAAPEESREG